MSLCALSPRHDFRARWVVRRCLLVNRPTTPRLYANDPARQVGRPLHLTADLGLRDLDRLDTTVTRCCA
jgi:hypothetical protein